MIWSDGDWEASDDYWGSKDVLAWLYNSSPVKGTVVVNDRWGNGTTCKHGGVWNCADRYNPGHILPHKWENAFTIDKNSWSHRRNANIEDFLSPEEIIEQLVTTVSCGGNFLIDIGPTKDGMIPPIFQERLLQLGQWLGINGESIYGSSVWPPAQNDSVTDGVWIPGNRMRKRFLQLFWKKHGQLMISEHQKWFWVRLTLKSFKSKQSGNWVKKKKLSNGNHVELESQSFYEILKIINGR